MLHTFKEQQGFSLFTTTRLILTLSVSLTVLYGLVQPHMQSGTTNTLPRIKKSPVSVFSIISAHILQILLHQLLLVRSTWNYHWK